MARTRTWLAAFVVGIGLAVGCETATDPDRGEGPASDRLQASADSLVLRWIGETVSLTATVHDGSGALVPNRPVRWRGTESAVASVDSSGTVTALRAGRGAAVAEAGSLSVSVPIRVSQVPASLQVGAGGGAAPAPMQGPATLSAVGDTLRLSAVVKDQGGTVIGTPELRWTSADSTIASVDANGLVTARRGGVTTVQAVAGPATANVGVRVQQDVASVVLDTTAIAFTALGQSRVLRASATDRQGNVVPGFLLAWRSSDPSIASVDSAGKVTARGAGRTSVTVGSGKIETAATVTVTQAPVRLSVVPDEVVLDYLGATAPLRADVLDEGGSPIPGAPATWASSAPGTAHVDASGKVTAVAKGKATITASSGALSGRAQVEVRQVPAALRLSARELRLFMRGARTATLVASVVDGGGNALPSGSTVAWKVRNEAVATVADGVVTPVSTGVSWVVASADGFTDSARVRVDGQRFSLDPDEARIGWRASLSVRATYVDENGGELAIAPTLVSRDPTVASIAGGTVLGARPGTTWVVAAHLGESDSLRVVVENGPNRLELRPAGSRQWLGVEVSFSATATNGAGGSEDVTGTATWQVRDTTIVQSLGGARVRARNVGTTWVIARDARYGLVDSTRIDAVGGTRFSLVADTVRLGWGTDVPIAGTWLQDDFSPLAVSPTLVSRDPSIASVNGARVSGQKTGSVWVEAQYRSEKDSVIVIVQNGPTRLELRPANSRQWIGVDVEFSARAVNSLGGSQDVTSTTTWQTRDTVIARNALGLPYIGTRGVGSTWVIARDSRYGLVDSTRIEVVTGTRYSLTPDTLRMDWGKEVRTIRGVWLQDDFSPLTFAPNLTSRDRDIVVSSGSGLFGINVGSAWVDSEYRFQRDSAFVIVENGPVRLEARPRDRVLTGGNSEISFTVYAYSASNTVGNVEVTWQVRDTTVLRMSGPATARPAGTGETWVLARSARYNLVDSVKVRVDGGIWEGDLVIATQADVERVRALQVREVRGDLEVIRSSATNLDGLESIRTVTESVWVDGNSALTSLSGLKVASIGRDLVITGNPLARNLTGLGAMPTVPGEMRIRSNAALTIAAFAALRSVGGALIVRENGGMATSTPFPALESVPSGMDFSELGASASFPALRTAPLVVNGGGPTSMSFPELVSASSLELNGPATTTFSAPRLAGPTNLTLIGVNGMSDFELPAVSQGSVRVAGGSIRSVRLPALRSASTIEVTDNSGIQTLSFPGLQSVGTLRLRNSRIQQMDWGGVDVVFAHIEQMPALTAITLGSVGSSSTRFSINYNPVLGSINLPRAAMVQELTITTNPALPALAIPALRTATQYFTIRDNAAITNLSWMSGVTGFIGQLNIEGNRTLTSIQGMSQLGASLGGDPIVGFLSIQNNTALPAANIQAVVAAIEARYPGSAYGTTRISGNGP